MEVCTKPERVSDLLIRGKSFEIRQQHTDSSWRATLSEEIVRQLLVHGFTTSRNGDATRHVVDLRGWRMRGKIFGLANVLALFRPGDHVMVLDCSKQPDMRISDLVAISLGVGSTRETIKHLKHLDFSGSMKTCRPAEFQTAFSAFLAFTSSSLVSLELSNTLIGDKALAVVAQRCLKLQLLDVSSCAMITDKGLDSVISSLVTSLRCIKASSNHQIRSVFLVKPQLNSVLVFSSMIKHCFLDNNTNVDNLAISLIARACRSLETLSIEGCSKVNDKGMKHVVLCSKNICSLFLSHTRVSSAFVDILCTSNMIHLSTLGLSYTDITWDDVEKIMSQLPQLQTLDAASRRSLPGVFRAKIKDYQLQDPRYEDIPIRNFASLQNLNLENWRCSKLLKHLSHFPKLSSLNLSGCQVSLTENVIILIFQTCNNLQSLNLSRCNCLTDACVDRLIETRHTSILKELNISSSFRERINCFSSSGLANLLRWCPEIVKINLGNQSAVTFVSLSFLGKAASSINLDGCKNVTPNLVKHLVRNWPYLEHVSLNHCSQLPNQALLNCLHGWFTAYDFGIRLVSGVRVERQLEYRVIAEKVAAKKIVRYYRNYKSRPVSLAYMLLTKKEKTRSSLKLIIACARAYLYRRKAIKRNNAAKTIQRMVRCRFWRDFITEFRSSDTKRKFEAAFFVVHTARCFLWRASEAGLKLKRTSVEELLTRRFKRYFTKVVQPEVKTVWRQRKILNTVVVIESEKGDLYHLPRISMDSSKLPLKSLVSSFANVLRNRKKLLIELRSLMYKKKQLAWYSHQVAEKEQRKLLNRSVCKIQVYFRRRVFRAKSNLNCPKPNVAAITQIQAIFRAKGFRGAMLKALKKKSFVVIQSTLFLRCSEILRKGIQRNSVCLQKTYKSYFGENYGETVARVNRIRQKVDNLISIVESVGMALAEDASKRFALSRVNLLSKLDPSQLQVAAEIEFAWLQNFLSDVSYSILQMYIQWNDLQKACIKRIFQQKKYSHDQNIQVKETVFLEREVQQIKAGLKSLHQRHCALKTKVNFANTYAEPLAKQHRTLLDHMQLLRKNLSKKLSLLADSKQIELKLSYKQGEPFTLPDLVDAFSTKGYYRQLYGEAWTALLPANFAIGEKWKELQDHTTERQKCLRLIKDTQTPYTTPESAADGLTSIDSSQPWKAKNGVISQFVDSFLSKERAQTAHRIGMFSWWYREREELIRLQESVRLKQKEATGFREGISELVFTVGREESRALTLDDTYSKIERDIGKEEPVFLWFKRTTIPQQFITDVKMFGKHHKGLQDYQRVTHPRLHGMTLWVTSKPLQGKINTILEEMRVSYNAAHERLFHYEGFQCLNVDLKKFRLSPNVKLWKLHSSSKKKSVTLASLQNRHTVLVKYLNEYPDSKELQEKLELLNTQILELKESQTPSNIKDELQEAVQFLGLSANDLNAFVTCFSDIDTDRSGNLSLDEFLEYVDIDHTAFIKTVFQFFDASGDGLLSFGEFVYFLGRFCLFETNDLLRMVFNFMDTQGVGTAVIDQEQATTPSLRLFIGQIQKKYNGQLSFDGFVSLHRRYPAVIYPAFMFQRNLRQSFLGEKWWRRKQRLFAKARQAVRKQETSSSQRNGVKLKPMEAFVSPSDKLA